MITYLCLAACVQFVTATQKTELFQYEHSKKLIQTSSTINVINNTWKTVCFYTCFAKEECCASSFDTISGTCLIDISGQWTTGSGGYLYTKLLPDVGSVKPQDCSMLPTGSCSGKYKIYPDGINGVDVYCDMSTDGGFWTIYDLLTDMISRGHMWGVDPYKSLHIQYKTEKMVFQKVKESNIPFDIYWNDYRDGFGDPNGDFWLGNKYIYTLTSQATFQLRIDFWDNNDVHRYAIYETFAINDENDKYRLLLGNYVGGDAGDGLFPHDGAQFSTRDNDNDGLWDYNCAKDTNGGGFWYINCHKVDMNGSRDYNGITVKRSVMMIRKV